MGKASKWFRGLLGLKKPDSSCSSSPSQLTTSKPLPKKKWSFVKSFREKEHQQDFHNKPIENSRTLSFQNSDNDDHSNHAIAVAAATAAVAEAAVASAHAAAAVVKLTSSGRTIDTNATTTATDTTMSTTSLCDGAEAALNTPSTYFSGRSAGCGKREEWAAVMIQKHFRAYLSRRALRALRALVRLQALVRGHIVRKGTTAMLRTMQALLRAQVRARVGRAQNFESPFMSNQFIYPGPATPEKFEHMIKARSLKHGENLMLKRNGSKSNNKFTGNQEKAHNGSNSVDCRMDVRSFEQEVSSTVKTNTRDDEWSDKILEVDTGKPHTILRRRNLFHSSHLSLGSDQYSHSFTTSKDSTARQTVPSPSSCEIQSQSPLKFSQDIDEEPFCTADNSPQFYSPSSKCGPANKGQFTPTKSDGSRSCLSGNSDHPNYMSYTESSKAKMRSLSAPRQRPQYEISSSTKRYSIHGFGEPRINSQKVSALHSNFTSKVYPGSGRLDRLGMPLREEAIEFSGAHWLRY